MQLYMNCIDPEERRIREFRMKEVLRELSNNPGAQSSYFQLEVQPRISGVQNKDLGRVFGFRTAEPMIEKTPTDGGLANSRDKGLTERGNPHNVHNAVERIMENQKESQIDRTPRQNEQIVSPRETMEGSGEYLPPKSGAIFAMGHDDHSASGACSRKSFKRKGSSWRILKQAPTGA
ncbi:hypothetical protein F2Q70_00015131 [Brassica cretica]|uniref:Uncharacterized protein n=1 Tax=Brassica cretica TaxID=69181 RepID=A0A8S9I049_BRACR|nr:hypothetical protein F2Q70_00015131 [Brassica cretica]